MSRRPARRGRPAPLATPEDTADLVAAAELVIAALDGRPVLPLVEPRRIGSLIAGFIALTAELGEALTRGDENAFRKLLESLQAAERLKDLFGDGSEGGQSPP